MRRVNKPFDLAEGVQAEADLRIDLSSFQMKILRDGEMAQWLRKGPALQGNPSSILSIHVGEFTTVRKSSFGGDLTLSSGLRGYNTTILVCTTTAPIYII